MSYTVTDKVIKLGEGNIGSTQDLGIVFTRGDGITTNTKNQSLIWQESTDSFAFVATNTEDGSTAGSVTVDGFADLKVGKLEANSDSVFSANVSVNGSLTVGGNSISSAELGYLDSVNPGTADASKAIVLDENSDISGINNITIQGELSAQTLDIGGVNITAIADEINKLDDITPGSVSNGKVVIVDDQKNITGFNNVSLSGKLSTNSISLDSVDVTASGHDINKLTGVVAGSVSAGKSVVVDNNNSISGFKDIAGSGTISTSNINVSGITSVNSLTSESENGSIKTSIIVCRYSG